MKIFTSEYENTPDGTARVALDETIMEKDRRVTAGSQMLKNFLSPIEATVTERLRSGGYTVAGRVITPEFNLPPLDKTDPLFVGAVEAVASGKADFSLSNDVFGIVRQASERAGLCYIQPSYGTVSRYGLIPLASSMDRAGIVCKTPRDGFALLEKIAGHDARDGAMYADSTYSFAHESKNYRLGIPELLIKQTSSDGKEAVKNMSERFESVNIELSNLELYKQLMYILVSAELSCNISRYDGIKFGHRAESFADLDELYTKSRTEGFGETAKFFALAGCLALSSENYFKYYDKALRLRRVIRDSFDFKGYDAIVMPCYSDANEYDSCVLYALTQLCGFPSLTLPCGGAAVSIIAPGRSESTLLSIADIFNGR